MSEPTTNAGRALLDDHPLRVFPMDSDEFAERISGVEKAAYGDGYRDGLYYGRDAAVTEWLRSPDAERRLRSAMLAASGGPWESDYAERVLAAFRGDDEDRDWQIVDGPTGESTGTDQECGS